MTDSPDLPPRLVRALETKVRQAQRDWRTPGISAGVVRDGRLVWSAHVGSARLEPAQPGTDDTQFMIGSITKTFTAVLVMQLRDEGVLELDAPLSTWLPGTRHGGPTVRQLLSHASGMQREPIGRVWETLDPPDTERMLRELEQAERPLPPHFVFHYSNLAFGLLGHVVELLRGQPWEQVVRARVLDPLGMTRTGLVPGADRALGYQIDPYARTATEMPLVDLRATAPMGGLWSTVADMARYAAFVAAPDPAVLRPETVDEMCRPLVIVDQDTWGAGYGLGYSMTRSGERILVGHGGSMPGYLSGLQVRRPERTGAFVVANSTADAASVTLATALVDAVVDELPATLEPWVPEQPRPDLAELLGVWWSEGEQLVLEVREGQLWMRVPASELPMHSTRFEAEGPDGYRAVEGRERGERLELVRDASGRVTKLYFATYAVTREPRAFATS